MVFKEESYDAVRTESHKAHRVLLRCDSGSPDFWLHSRRHPVPCSAQFLHKCFAPEWGSLLISHFLGHDQNAYYLMLCIRVEGS